MSFYLKISLISFVIFISCTSSKEEIEESNGSASQSANQTIDFESIFNLIPTQKSIVNTVSTSNTEYNPELLNNPDIAHQYSAEQSQALNLGVYGSDLNVTSIYEQAQESILFLKCVNVLAKNLGIGSAFDEKMIERMDANKENRDSTLEIISQAFRTSDSFLKANGRANTSALIITGAWIEGIYIASKVGKETGNKEIVKEIVEQKASLHLIIKSLQSSQLSENTKYLLEDLEDLNALLESKNKAHTFSLEDLNEIDLKITALRTKIISLN